MSCRLKNTNPDKYGPPPRSDYDKMMMERYVNQLDSYHSPIPQWSGQPGEYHSPPWQGDRTNEDRLIQKEWCPTCPPSIKERFEFNNLVNSNSNTPWLAPRTDFDQAMQARFCPKCGAVHPQPHPDPQPQPHPQPPSPSGPPENYRFFKY